MARTLAGENMPAIALYAYRVFWGNARALDYAWRDGRRRTRHFSRWMRNTELVDSALCAAVAETSTGLMDAHVASKALKEICHDNEG